MKRSEKAKAGPKFRVGQVVRVKSKELRHWTPDYWRVARISVERKDNTKFVYWVSDHDKRGPWIGEKSLRPLTSRESGQRQRKGGRPK